MGGWWRPRRDPSTGVVRSPSVTPRARRVDPAPGAARRAQRWLFAVALAGVAAGTVAGTAAARAEEDQDAEQVADARAEQATVATEAVVERAVGALAGAAALVDGDGTTDREAFRAYADGLGEDLVFGVALGTVVDGAERSAFEAAEVPIVRVRGDGELVAAPPASTHYPIVELATDDPARRSIIGLDYGADAARRAALEQARDTGRTAASPPTRVGAFGDPGFVLVRPLYRRGADVSTVEARREAFAGYVSAAYSAEMLIAELRPHLRAGTSISVLDGDDALVDVGDNEELEKLDRTLTVGIAGRTWDMTIASDVRPQRTLSSAIVVGGIAGEVVLLLVFAVTVRYQRRLRAAYGAQRQAQQRTATFESLAARLSRSLSSAEVGEALLQQLPSFTGTSAGAVFLLDNDAAHLGLLAADGYTAEEVRELERIDLGEPSALADVVRRAEPAWLPSPLAWRDDAITSNLGAAGRAMAIIPLVADHRVAGVLVLVHPGVRTFYADERSMLMTVAVLAARAVLRARRYDTEHDAAAVLQRALLPSTLPAMPDVAVAVRYLPATHGLAVGGDWYDVFPVADGKVAIVVGDVVGHGVKAAAAMGRLRSAIRALAEVVPRPAALLEALQAHIGTIPDALCATTVYALVDPEAGTLTYVRAGHPPPLLVRPGGEPRLLSEGVSPPLGVTRVPSPPEATVTIEAGDLLVLYTDGIVERRGEPVTTGLERLRQIGARLAELDPDASCDLIVQAMLGETGHADDAAVVALRVQSAPIAVAARTTTAATFAR